jgi:hypothetical protein
MLHKVDLVRYAPIPQRSLGTLGLECIPLVETSFRREKIFETRVRSTVRPHFDTRGRLVQRKLDGLSQEPLPKVASKAVEVRISNRLSNAQA